MGGTRTFIESATNRLAARVAKLRERTASAEVPRPFRGPELRAVRSSAAHITSEQDFTRADDGIRTRDPNLGKVVLYQLSHVRV